MCAVRTLCVIPVFPSKSSLHQVVIRHASIFLQHSDKYGVESVEIYESLIVNT